MIVLFGIVVVAGMAIPFLMDDTVKGRILGYGLDLISIILLMVMVMSDIAGLPGYEKSEAIAIGTALIVLGITVAKGHKIINPKQSKKAKAEKTHQKMQQHNHKAAS